MTPKRVGTTISRAAIVERCDVIRVSFGENYKHSPKCDFLKCDCFLLGKFSIYRHCFLTHSLVSCWDYFTRQRYIKSCPEAGENTLQPCHKVLLVFFKYSYPRYLLSLFLLLPAKCRVITHWKGIPSPESSIRGEGEISIYIHKCWDHISKYRQGGSQSKKDQSSLKFSQFWLSAKRQKYIQCGRILEIKLFKIKYCIYCKMTSRLYLHINSALKNTGM